MTVPSLSATILGGAVVCAPFGLLLGLELEVIGGMLIGALVVLAGLGGRSRRGRRLRSFDAPAGRAGPPHREARPPLRRPDGLPGPNFAGWRGAHTLDYLGVYETLKTDGGACVVCGDSLSVSSLGAVYPAGDEVALVCRDPDCLRAAAAHSLEDRPG